MTDRRQLYFGNVPVPYTVAWQAEERTLYLGTCPHANRVALRQRHTRGAGKPLFGSPHADRQREAIACDLCDLCGRPLKNRTKVSLSQARSRMNAASPMDVLQVEPLLHKQCAAICMQHCPSLRRQQRDGVLNIRQVLRHRCQFAICSEQGVFEAVGIRQRAVSHAKVQLLKFTARDEGWLTKDEA
jgi:hypothetical protein